MKNLAAASSALLLALSLNSTAAAATKTYTVAAGKTTPIESFAIFSRNNCYAGPYAKPSIGKVKNGKITVKKTKFKIPKGKQCAGKTVLGLVVYFTPDPGFRGQTTARFGFRYQRWATGTQTKFTRVNARINVK